MGGVCRSDGEGMHVQDFGWENLGERSLGRTRRRWYYNIKMNLQEIGCGGMGWIKLTHGRDRWRALVNAVINICVP
jgi:hypothetical protein